MILEIAIVLVTVVGVLYYLMRGRFRVADGHGADGRGTGDTKRTDTPEVDPEKGDALERFRAVHAKARDNLSKVHDGIEEDPRRAAKAFRQFMKRD